MIAISDKRDQIWLQWSRICFLEIRPEIKVMWLYDDFRHCNCIRSRLSSLLQSYLVPFVTIIAIIFGPHQNIYCNHKWFSPIFSTLYSFQILFECFHDKRSLDKLGKKSNYINDKYVPSTNRRGAQISKYLRQYIDNDIILVWYSDLGCIQCYFVLSNMALRNRNSKTEKNSNSSLELRANRLM